MKMGKKTAQWNAIRRRLKVEFEERGITSCELRLPGCMPYFALSFAHAKKRRKLREDAPEGDPENIRTVCVACGHCHPIIEQLKSETMCKLVMEAIEKRGHGNGQARR
jgi:hypothetical protein